MVKWDGLSRFNRIVMFGLYGSERNTNIRIYGICMIKTKFSIFLCFTKSHKQRVGQVLGKELVIL